MSAPRPLDPAPATMLFSMRVAAADAAAAADEMRALNALMREQAGFRHLDVLRRDEAAGVEFCLLVHFDSEAALTAWKSAPARRAAIARIERHAIGDVRRQEALGNDPWFQPLPAGPGARPPSVPFWKRWVLSILAVYPGLALLLLVADPLLSGVPWALRLFVVVAVMTGLMAAWIVPALTRLLQGWLTGGAPAR